MPSKILQFSTLYTCLSKVVAEVIFAYTILLAWNNDSISWPIKYYWGHTVELHKHSSWTNSTSNEP